MSLSSGPLARSILVCILFACSSCGGPQSEPGEPQTAKEKQMQEAQAKGELERPGAQWGGWRYQGERKDCFFIVGRRCFKTENAACQAAHCKSPKKCDSAGGGPATVSCK